MKMRERRKVGEGKNDDMKINVGQLYGVDVLFWTFGEKRENQLGEVRAKGGIAFNNRS